MDVVFYLPSPIGFLEIKSDGDHINAITFVDAQQTTENTLDIPAVVSLCVAELEAYFGGKLSDFSFPMQQKGTDFQQKVWKELVDIPFGKTISYLELSRRIGDEKAIRAVGTTNGKNKIAIVVPCHRVIGSDGSLTGYAGGLWRKQWLLDLERNASGKGGNQLGLF